MKQHTLLSKQPWMMPFGILVLILGPVILYLALRGAGVPATVVSAVVLLVAAKHLGLLAVISAPVYALLRRRSPHSKPDPHDSPDRDLAGRWKR